MAGLFEVAQIVLLLLVAWAPPVILSIRLRNAERRRREPWQALWRAFAWGAVGAAGLAIVVESALEPVFPAGLAVLGVPAFLVLAVPIVEELLKALGLRVIRDPDPEPEDGYIYGGAVGLGFAASENALYILNAFAFGGQEVAFATALYRGIAVVALHGSATAIVGYGVWRARYGGAGLAALRGILFAIALHVAYNFLAARSLGWATILAAGIAVVAYLRIMRRVTILDAQA